MAAVANATGVVGNCCRMNWYGRKVYMLATTLAFDTLLLRPAAVFLEDSCAGPVRAVHLRIDPAASMFPVLCPCCLLAPAGKKSLGSESDLLCGLTLSRLTIDADLIPLRLSFSTHTLGGEEPAVRERTVTPTAQLRACAAQRT